MLYTNNIDALPAEYEVEARNLASRDRNDRDDIIKAVRKWHYRLSGHRRKGYNARYAGHAMFAGGGGASRTKGAGGGVRGKGGDRGEGKGGRRRHQGRRGKGTNEDGGGWAAAAGSHGRSAKAVVGNNSEVRCHRCGRKGHWRVDCTGKLCRRCHGQEHAADFCRTLKEEGVLATSDDDNEDHYKVEASAFKAGEAGECSDVHGE